MRRNFWPVLQRRLQAPLDHCRENNLFLLERNLERERERERKKERERERKRERVRKKERERKREREAKSAKNIDIFE